MVGILIITLVILVILLGISVFVARMVARMQYMDHEYFDGRPEKK